MTILPEQSTSSAMAEITAETGAVMADDAQAQVFEAMSMTQIALYRRIQAFDVDEVNDSLSFSRRLARDNGWPIQFALRVVEEYKRFVFLAIAADHAVTPSDQVDQAWHLHLTYSRNYWDDFCPNVLKQSLHHDPTRGGEAEGEKFDSWYTETLASYEHFFDEVPPSDIWPAPKVRFDRDLAFVRVNAQQKWVIPKLPIPREVVGGITAVALAGLWLRFMDYDGSLSSSNEIGGFLVAVLSAIAGYSLIQLGAGCLDALNRPKGVGGCGSGGGGCGGCGGSGGGGCGGG